ncbi:hypothetical protein AWC05_05615 [Mycobacterium florentinum]|uniref:Uncharacterized protein n=1 Tax=Mycobacterium florentinum TaxID=292462 RepID=A0A1X1TTV9_MYCFL|nr:hypothetical protein AWC05_05615 [Mycobacterium florentinum]
MPGAHPAAPESWLGSTQFTPKASHPGEDPMSGREILVGQVLHRLARVRAQWGEERPGGVEAGPGLIG